MPVQVFRAWQRHLRERLWGSALPATAEDERMLAQHLRERTALNVLWWMPVLVVFAFGGWPLDFLVFEDAFTLQRLALWRIAVTGVNVTAYFLYRDHPWVRARPTRVFAALAAVNVVVTAAILVDAGGPNRPFLQSAYLLAWVPIGYAGALRARLAVSALLVAVWIVATLSFHPSVVYTPNFLHSITFFVSITALCVAAGHIVYRLTRQSFLQERFLARRAEELSRFKAQLETRVDERTRDLRDLAARLTQVLENERSRIARDIHDDLGQALGAIRLEVEVAERQLARRGPAPDAAPLAESLRRLKEPLEETLTTSRRLLSQLRPRVLDDLGLRAALAWLVDDTPRVALRCSLAFEPQALEVEPERALALFRIVQECLANTVRHAGATTFRVALRETAEGLELHVADDGRGGAGQRVADARAVGLLGMRERVAQFGGRFRCDSPVGGGTRIDVFLPSARAARMSA